MSSIPSDSHLTQKCCSKEFVITASGGALFGITTLCVAIILIANPPSVLLYQIVGYTVFGTLSTAGLATFIVGLFLMHRKTQQNQKLREQEEEEIKADLEKLTPPAKIEVEEVELEETETASLDYIDEVRRELGPLFDSIEEFLNAIVIGYYNTQGKHAPQKSYDQVHAATVAIAQEINGFLQSPREIFRVAIGISIFSLIDDKLLEQLLKESDGSVILKLTTTFKEPEEKYQKQAQLSKHILGRLIQQANLNSPELRNKVKEVRRAFGSIATAKTEEDEIANRFILRGALISLIDALYLNATLEEEKVKQWTAHLVPPFLENWRDDFFKNMGESMKSFNLSFKPGGIFNDSKTQKLAYFGTTFPKTFIYPKIDSIFAPLPLLPERKTALQAAAKTILPALLNPFYYGTFDQKNPFRRKLEKIICANDFKPPELQEGSTWGDYIKAYSDFFKHLANQLRSMQ